MKKKRKEKYPYWWAITYGTVLIGCTGFVLLKAFVMESAEITHVVTGGIYSSTNNGVGEVESNEQNTANEETMITDTSYQDENIQIQLEERRVNETTVYVVDVQLSDISYLKTALASDTYGRNIKETTSEMAEQNQAILAINGDYYGFRDYGYVLRNGVLYRSNYGDVDDEAFVIYEDGSCETVVESEVSAESLLEKGAMQVLTFGPGLIKDGGVSVGEYDEVDQAKTSNPRTAIGMISPLHYVFVVADGRTDESKGLTLYELAQVMQDIGCVEAYNLDGGGSSTLWFNGKIINNPTSGKKIGEREVSDIVYIG